MRTPLTPVWDYETRIGALAVGNSSPGFPCVECIDASTPLFDNIWSGLSALPVPWDWGDPGNQTLDWDSDGMYVAAGGSGQCDIGITGLSVPCRSITVAVQFLDLGDFGPGNDTENFQFYAANNSFSKFLLVVASGKSDVPGDATMQSIVPTPAVQGPYYETTPMSGVVFVRFDSCGQATQYVYGPTGILLDFIDTTIAPVTGIPLNQVIIQMTNLNNTGSGPGTDPAHLRIIRTAIWSCYLSDADQAAVAAAWT
jgi:hypothetical protein